MHWDQTPNKKPKKLSQPEYKALAERMQLNHNTMVELVDRCEEGGLLRRVREDRDRRLVTLAPTPAGKRVMEDQASASRAELQEIGPVLFYVIKTPDGIACKLAPNTEEICAVTPAPLSVVARQPFFERPPNVFVDSDPAALRLISAIRLQHYTVQFPKISSHCAEMIFFPEIRN